MYLGVTSLQMGFRVIQVDKIPKGMSIEWKEKTPDGCALRALISRDPGDEGEPA